jgi:hypothetical protein
MPEVLRLDAAVRAVCPAIDGVSIGNWADRGTWRVDFQPAATAPQRAAAANVIATFDPNAITWAEIRERRNALLAATDWAVIPDSSGTNANRLAWAAYRQALKDIPQTFASPDLVVWPTPPAYTKSAEKAVQFYRIAATFGGPVSFVLPARCYIAGIILANTTANAVTGGLKFGSASGGVDVVAAVPVGANATLSVPDALVLKRFFSLSAPQSIFIDAVTAWNGASIVGAVIYGQL